MAEADPKLAARQAGVSPLATTDEPPARTPRRWRHLLLMVSVPLLIALVGGYVWLTSGRYISTDNAYVRQDMISISPDVSGRIVAVEVRENQAVKAGDVLFRIDPEPYRIALAQADAALFSARVQVGTLTTETSTAAADIAAATADVKLAEATYERQDALMKRGFTTRASLDAATHEVAAARARLATARASVAKARSQLGSGTTSSGLPAAIQAAMAEHDKAALALARVVVRAPRDGIISQTSRLQVGTITPSGVPAVSLVINETAWVEANFKETDLDHMVLGQRAEVSFDAYPGMKLCGHVASMGAGTGSEFSVLPAQNANGNWVKVTQRVPVRIGIDCKASRPMIAGLSADVTIDTRPRG